MQVLQEKIREQGSNLGNGILKVDGLINHQIDAELMVAMGNEFARRFRGQGVTRILTAEVSGIAPALATASVLGVPMVYARKHKPITMKEPVFVESAPSHTKGGEVHLMVSPEYLTQQDRVLIIDDFLASGKTIDALARLVKNAGATLVGIGAIIEKSFEGGRTTLQQWRVPIEALAIIDEMHDDGRIVFAE
ncbi:MAG: xanthine phosphoribosyltransferase [Anaerolineae bacterium]|nr:xanthine phosphoribosyltransferase [Anaerolineae bacterium]